MFGILRRLRAWWWVRRHRRWADYPHTMFRHGHPCGVPLAPYVRRFARKDCYPEPKAYRVALSEGTGSESRWGRYRDGAYGFVLLFYGTAAAIVTWDVDDERGIIHVKQVQGVKGNGDLLRPLRWEKMLLQLVLDWATANGYTQARLTSSGAHEWYERCETRATMRLKYEVTGKRMGFRPVPGEKYLVRQLTEEAI